MSCDKGNCNKNNKNSCDKSKINSLRRNAILRSLANPLDKKVLSLQEELELTKAELEKTKAELAAAQAPKNMLGHQGFKPCAEVTFIPKQEESK